MWLYTNGEWYQKVEPGLLPYTNNSFVEQGFGRLYRCPYDRTPEGESGHQGVPSYSFGPIPDG